MSDQPRDPHGRYPSGQSGNPSGRPKGGRNKSAELVEKWAGEHLGSFLAVLPQLAVNDPSLMKFVLSRITPKIWRPAPSFSYGNVSSLSAINCTLERAAAALDAGEIDHEAFDQVISTLIKLKAFHGPSGNQDITVDGANA